MYKYRLQAKSINQVIISPISILLLCYQQKTLLYATLSSFPQISSSLHFFLCSSMAALVKDHANLPLLHKGVQDPSSPYFLHPNESPAPVLIYTLLNGSNYHAWSRAMKMSLLSKNKLTFSQTEFNPICEQLYMFHMGQNVYISEKIQNVFLKKKKILTVVMLFLFIFYFFDVCSTIC